MWLQHRLAEHLLKIQHLTVLKQIKRHRIDVKMDVILNTDGKTHPCCPHGPAFLFKKSDPKRHTSRKFFGCSANRNRKFCNFFHWADEPITEEKRQTWEDIARRHLDSLNLGNLRARQQNLQLCAQNTQLKFCRTCSLLLFSNEWSKHSSHGTLNSVAYDARLKPTTFLMPLEEKKTNAQYFFSDKCVKFVLESLKRFEMKKVLCIGAPRILEAILSRREDLNMDGLLLDIDHRYAQFYRPENFILYNLFNHHFFEGSSDYRRFLDFISGPEEIALVIDPPFGGMISAISQTIHKISQLSNKQLLPLLMFFPYFNEDRILQEMPSLKMLDYKVNYTNHEKFKEGGLKQGSVVRIYTNVDAAKFILPKKEGYKFCSICKRFVSRENMHCVDCNSCTSKDGRPYKHCQECGRCCKSSWEHCPQCKRCALPNHPCQDATGLDSSHNEYQNNATVHNKDLPRKRKKR